MPIDKAEAIRRINNDELNCPKCHSDIIDADDFPHLICRWCEHEWNVEEGQDEPPNNRTM